MHFWWSSAFPRHSHSTGSRLSSTENTGLWIESTLRFSTPSTLLLRILILHQVIPSLIGYIIIVINFNCGTWSFFPEHNFRRQDKLMSIFLAMSFHLKQQAWVRVCVVTVVPITSCFIIPLTWCRRWLTTSAWNLSTIVSWSSSAYQALLGYQVSSWWEIPSLPSMICFIIDHFIAFHSTSNCSCFVLYLEILAIQHLFFFTLEYYHLLCQECRGNFTTSWEFLI